MGAEAVRKLQTQWQSNKDLKDALNRAFDRIGFDDAYVDRCIASARNGSSPRKTKFVKDNIWGMIEIEPGAVRLLDSPLLQRLRTIKQLGLSYVTYPSADHSRFTHSLGVMCVASRFLEAIDKRAHETQSASAADYHYVAVDKLSPLTKEEILYAALLHDIGHLPFSHASEKILEAQEDRFSCGPLSVGEFVSAANRILGKNLHLSEVLSIVIVLSERFERFYRNFVQRDSEDPASLARIGSLIAGVAPEPRLSGVTEIISASALDADKIDYVNRDAAACGIPAGVDVARVFLRSGFVQASKDEIIRRQLKIKPTGAEILFVVNASGMDTLDEIVQARTALYQRVYLHAVTRTAEAMLARALEINATSSNKLESLCNTLSLWTLSDEGLIQECLNAGDPKVSSYGNKLRNRQLPKKACVFSRHVAEMHYPLSRLFPYLANAQRDDETLAKHITYKPLEQLNSKVLSGNSAANIETLIRREIESIARLLKNCGYASVVPTEDLETVVLVPSAYMDHVHKDCVVLLNGQLLHAADMSNSRPQQDAYDIAKAIGYVMTDPEWRAIGLIASRTILCRVEGPPRPTVLPPLKPSSELSEASTDGDLVHFVHRMILDLDAVIRRVGIRPTHIYELMGLLEEQGYFDDKPLLATPIGHGHRKVAEIADKFRSFDGQRSWKVTSESVAAYSNQFPPRLREELLDVLQKIIFFDAVQLSHSILEPIRSLGGDVDVVPLSPNSGQMVRIRIEQEESLRGLASPLRFRRDLKEALDTDVPGRPIILVDDNIASSVQARAQFYRWANIPRNEWPVECQDEHGIHDATLSELELERFRTRPLHIFVCAARSVADERVRSVLQRLGFTNFQSVRSAHSIEPANACSPELRSFFEQVGCSIMAWAKFGKVPAELPPEQLSLCEGHAFGYENAGGLTVTAWNVPTSTITALWSPGMFGGSPWMPLFLRRDKLRHLVLG